MEIKKQIPINLYSDVCCTLHANPGVHSLYNIITAPPRFRQTAVLVIDSDVISPKTKETLPDMQAYNNP